jgi:hypothetical protein
VQTMATARKYHWELLGDSAVHRDAGPLTSAPAISGRPASGGPTVITSSTLHTLWLLWGAKYDLGYLRFALPRSHTRRTSRRVVDGFALQNRRVYLCACPFRAAGERIGLLINLRKPRLPALRRQCPDSEAKK